VRRMPALVAVGTVALAAVVAVPAAASPTSTQHHRPAVFAAPAGPALGIGHVFVIVLENKSFDEAYGSGSGYLGSTLAPTGRLLTEYYGVAHLSNPNYIALVSGQGPNVMTQSDCQDYVDFQPSPAVFDPRGNGQAVGQGCVYPADVPTVADQLHDAGLTWHGYMEDMGSNAANREPAHCGEPAFSAGTGFRDGTQTATATDQYAARHNPFVYFHSLIDSGACHANVVPLSVLDTDLASIGTTPNFSFITPDLCSDGHDAPCADGRPGGIASINDFLQTWVAKIQASPAYQQDGLIVVTTDESEWNQSEQDSASCCGEEPGPNSPMPGITGPGGGRIGTLVVGRCVAPGTDATPYNHYSLLRTVEDLFGINSGGADGHGHLGYAAAAGVTSFGTDVFSACPTPVAAPASKG